MRRHIGRCTTSQWVKTYAQMVELVKKYYEYAPASFVRIGGTFEGPNLKGLVLGGGESATRRT